MTVSGASPRDPCGGEPLKNRPAEEAGGARIQAGAGAEGANKPPKEDPGAGGTDGAALEVQEAPPELTLEFGPDSRVLVGASQSDPALPIYIYRLIEGIDEILIDRLGFPNGPNLPQALTEEFKTFVANLPIGNRALAVNELASFLHAIATNPFNDIGIRNRSKGLAAKLGYPGEVVYDRLEPFLEHFGKVKLARKAKMEAFLPARFDHLDSQFDEAAQGAEDSEEYRAMRAVYSEYRIRDHYGAIYSFEHEENLFTSLRDSFEAWRASVDTALPVNAKVVRIVEKEVNGYGRRREQAITERVDPVTEGFEDLAGKLEPAVLVAGGDSSLKPLYHLKFQHEDADGHEQTLYHIDDLEQIHNELAIILPKLMEAAGTNEIFQDGLDKEADGEPIIVDNMDRLKDQLRIVLSPDYDGHPDIKEKLINKASYILTTGAIFRLLWQGKAKMRPCEDPEALEYIAKLLRRRNGEGEPLSSAEARELEDILINPEHPKKLLRERKAVENALADSVDAPAAIMLYGVNHDLRHAYGNVVEIYPESIFTPPVAA